MFETTCPECKREVNVINGQCENCGYSISDYMQSIGLFKDNHIITDKVYMCPKCGTVDAGEGSIRLKCYECGEPYKATDLDRSKYLSEIVLEENERDLIEKYVGDTINWDIYNKREEHWHHVFEEKEKQQKIRQQQIQQKQQEAINHCPKCGGTQFTPVRKKFSLLTGFATNKIELICNNCGAKNKS